MLVTMFDRRTLLSREVYNEVKGHYPSIVLNTTIPRSVKISEAPSFSQSVIAYDPRGIVPYRMVKQLWKSHSVRNKSLTPLMRGGTSNGIKITTW